MGSGWALGKTPRVSQLPLGVFAVGRYSPCLLPTPRPFPLRNAWTSLEVQTQLRGGGRHRHRPQRGQSPATAPQPGLGAWGPRCALSGVDSAPSRLLGAGEGLYAPGVTPVPEPPPLLV